MCCVLIPSSFMTSSMVSLLSDFSASSKAVDNKFTGALSNSKTAYLSLFLLLDSAQGPLLHF